MTQFFDPVLRLMLGLAMSVYGLIHAARNVPAAEHLHGFWAALPSMGAVGVFLLGVFAVTGGLMLLTRGVQGLRRRYRQIECIYRQPTEPNDPGNPEDDDGYPHRSYYHG